ncbi:uncharacterized protein LOC141621172 [Silene latifolia]|uniref:uncharacterized protein LOC141621172 n=1 Tax=Silene latifolia TaxID=37657 RepID=UPI003D78211F
MEKIEPFSGDFDLRRMEKIYEDLYLNEGEMEMEYEEVDERSSDVAACRSIVPITIVDEGREQWLEKRAYLKNRMRFMEELFRMWPKFGVLLEYENEGKVKEESFDVACKIDDSSNSDLELDPEAIRKNPVIINWFIKKLSKYWPDFDLTHEDESLGDKLKLI